MKLSIIVPVYNVAPYLRKCVDSLLAQDISDYEIILVDDGSTDNSGVICDEYAGQQPTSDSSLKGRESFASVWGMHTADSMQYKLLEANARENRKNPTEAESVLWDMLKGNNLGLHFRRQHIILDYIVDFICLEKGLIIELDGGYHNDPDQQEKDNQRTAHLTKLGYTELRFKNEELLIDPEGVIAKIKAVANKLPSLQGRNEKRFSLPSLQGRVWDRPLILVIHQKNGGLSAARNSGIIAAQGEYLMFVDSDDYIEPNVLGTLIEQMDAEQLDVLRFDFQNVRIVDAMKDYETFEPNKYPHPVDTRTKIVEGITYLNERMQYGCYAWQFIIRRDLLVNQQSKIDNIFFTEGIHFEDIDWMPRMMLRAKRVNGTRTIAYNYFWREGSITLTQGNKEKIRKNVEDRLLIVERLSMLLYQQPDCRWVRNMISMLSVGLLATIAQDLFMKRAEYISRLRRLNVFPLVIANQGKTYIRRAILINILGPNIFCIIKHKR